MVKLNKQEINAIANKTIRELTNIKESNLKELLKKYKPSDEYLKLKEQLDKLVAINISIKSSCEQRDELVKSISTTTKAYTYELCNAYTYEYPNKLLEGFKLKEIESALPSIPDITEIKEDITIAAIDEEFDVESFINKILSEYKFNL